MIQIKHEKNNPDPNDWKVFVEVEVLNNIKLDFP